MNWLFLDPIKGDDWGGMENWMLKLCQGLPAHGDSCLVAGRPRSRWPEVCRREGIAYVPFAFGFDLAPWALWRLRGICRRFLPGIVVAKGFRAARFARLAHPDAAVAVKLPSASELTSAWTDRATYHHCIDRVLVDNHCARQAFLRFPWVLPGKIVAVVEQRLHRRGTGYVELAAAHRNRRGSPLPA
jgi:hypothetical protein